jgi:hypothetical protein
MKFMIIALLQLVLVATASGQICLGLGDDGKCTGLSLDGLAKGERETNGIQLCAISEGSSCNGLSIGFLPSARLNGLAIGPIVDLHKANGVVIGCFVGGLGYIGPLASQIGMLNGLAIGATSSAGALNGVSVAMLNTVTKQRGAAIGILNQANELHGLQIGMINYAANNPAWLRYLPFLNFHL